MADKNVTIREGVHVADQVFVTIAGLAATEVDGVDSLSGNLTADDIPKSAASKLTKGVKITTDDDGSMHVWVSVNLGYGHEIPKVCAAVQDKVKSTVENMTGMTVSTVDVHIASVNINS